VGDIDRLIEGNLKDDIPSPVGIGTRNPTAELRKLDQNSQRKMTAAQKADYLDRQYRKPQTNVTSPLSSRYS